MNLVISAFSVFLAVLGPTLSICSTNTKFFTKKQIFHAILIATLLGLVLAIICAYIASLLPLEDGLSDALIVACAVWLFIVFNERFFTSIINKPLTRCFVLISFIVFAGAFTYFTAPIILTSCLLIFNIFACFDLYKRWNFPKTPLFCDNTRLLTAEIDDETKTPFIYKPNVYLLLLESFHSREAINKLYNFDDPELYGFLQNYGLVTYHKTFSNKHWTNLSLAALLTMSHEFEAPAKTLAYFKNNGYSISFFDTMLFLSTQYTDFLDEKTNKLPKRVEQWYRFAAPFFAQSRWIRYLLIPVFFSIHFLKSMLCHEA